MLEPYIGTWNENLQSMSSVYLYRFINICRTKQDKNLWIYLQTRDPPGLIAPTLHFGWPPEVVYFLEMDHLSMMQAITLTLQLIQLQLQQFLGKCYTLSLSLSRTIFCPSLHTLFIISDSDIVLLFKSSCCASSSLSSWFSFLIIVVTPAVDRGFGAA